MLGNFQYHSPKFPYQLQAEIENGFALKKCVFNSTLRMEYKEEDISMSKNIDSEYHDRSKNKQLFQTKIRVLLWRTQ